MRYEEMASFENLYQAHCKTRKGKRGQKEVVEFELDLGWNLQKLRGELMSGRYYPKPYKQYRIYDPKERVIHALQYRDRIVQHTLCDNVVVPYMERYLIYDNAASRVGKGTHFAMDRLDSFLHRFYYKYGTQGYFLKFDVRKYYDSIDHAILKKLIEKAFMEDSRIVNLLNIFIDSYTLPGQKGLPLGNQTSQMFALYYLDGLDRMIKEKFRVKYYTRYMDDGILVHNDKNLLISYLDEMKKYLAEERELELNQKTQIIPISQGVDYLGFHFYMTGTGKVIRKLRASNKRRIKRKLKHFRHGYRVGVISREEIERSLASYRGHLSHGNTYLFQENLLEHLVLSKQTQKEREEIDERTRQQITKNNFRGDCPKTKNRTDQTTKYSNK
ncbi:MAG: RNA-directed DNA polymerase [Lachnospiraceae bacterium]|nr:RNA-directed DNA polymerase [Lachnospiraceae bacterium]